MTIKFKLLIVFCLALLCSTPWILSPYYMTLLLPAVAYSIILLGFNLLLATLAFYRLVMQCMLHWVLIPLPS